MMRTKGGVKMKNDFRKYEDLNTEEKRASIESRTWHTTYDEESFKNEFPNFIDKKIGVRYENGLGSYVLNMDGWHGPDGCQIMLSEAIKYDFFCIERPELVRIKDK